MRTYTKKGFTLIELIISIAITVIIGGIILANYRVGQKQQTLRAEAQKLVSTLRQAQNMASAGKTYLYPDETKAEVPEYGYGVYVDDANNKYTLFANYCQSDYKSCVSSVCKNGLVNPEDQDIDTTDLALKKIDISVSLEGTSHSLSYPVFDFEPPKASPITVYYGPRATTSTNRKDSLNDEIVLITLEKKQAFRE